MNSSNIRIIYAVVFFLFIIVASHSPAIERMDPQTNVSPADSVAGLTAPAGNLRHVPVKVSDGVFRFGDIKINKDERSITFPAMVNMNEGLLEYLLVQSSGKTHESLLRTDVSPYDIQISLLLLGFEGTDRPLSYQGAPEKPKGEHMNITVTYNGKDNKQVSHNPEHWIVRQEGNGQIPVMPIDWVFTGSTVIDGVFLAQREGSVIAIFHDPASLVDNASPGGENDTMWYVNKETVPPAGTPVVLTLRAVK